jgi:hypothetical protein
MTEGEIAIVEAVKAIGRDIRGEILPLREEVAQLALDLASFRRSVGEELAGLRRDIASLRRSLFDETTRQSERVDRLEKKKASGE